MNNKEATQRRIIVFIVAGLVFIFPYWYQRNICSRQAQPGRNSIANALYNAVPNPDTSSMRQLGFGR